MAHARKQRRRRINAVDHVAIRRRDLCLLPAIDCRGRALAANLWPSAWRAMRCPDTHTCLAGRRRPEGQLTIKPGPENCAHVTVGNRSRLGIGNAALEGNGALFKGVEGRVQNGGVPVGYHQYQIAVGHMAIMGSMTE